MGLLGKVLGKSSPLDELEDVDETVFVAPETADAAEDAPDAEYEKVPVEEQDEEPPVELFAMEVSLPEDDEARSATPAYGVRGRIGPAPRFTWGEVACNDGTPLPRAKRGQAVELARTLNNLRAEVARYYGVPATRVFISINSWYRHPAYNVRVGGAAYSRHCEGDAADINITVKTSKGVRLVPRRRVRALAERRARFARGGIGAYATFTHLDTRGYRARWNGP